MQTLQVAEILKFHYHHLMWQLHVRQLINWLHFKANPRETLNTQNESKSL